jgi:formylglycine-generating enzyme required for sulfatase activity
VYAEALAAWIRDRIEDQDVLAWQQLIAPLGTRFSKPLEGVYRIEPQTVKRKALSRLIANIQQSDLTELTRFLDRANPDEILIWANAIGKDRMESFSIPWEDFETDEGYLAIKEPDCIKYANWAIARHALGNSDWLFRAFEDRPDPRVRTYTVHRFPDSELAIDTLIDRIAVETKADLMYGLLMAIAIAEPKSIKSSDFLKAKAWVLQSYETHPDSGVHGMCRTLIARWRMESEVVEVDRRLIEVGPDQKKDWYVNSVGMHMAIIKGNVTFWMGKPKGEKAEYAALSYEDGHISRIDKSYAIGMDEVTVGQYRLFDPLFFPDVGQASSVSNVSKLDCDQFCAWLTRQEMLDEVESPYSLPESSEWEYASRGRTVTPRFHGNFETSISTSFYVSLITDSVGFLLPNRYGLVSSIGSVAEWTKTIGMESKTKGYEMCFVRGGNSGFDQIESMRSNTSCARSIANSKGSAIGMRIVRRIPNLN